MTTQCTACPAKDRQIALLQHLLKLQTDATDATGAAVARLAERDHWIRERIAGERRRAGVAVP